jgi:hypothetical protein
VFGDVLQTSVDAPFIDGARQLELEDREYDGVVLWSTLTVVSTTCFECDARVGEKAGSLGGSGFWLAAQVGMISEVAGVSSRWGCTSFRKNFDSRRGGRHRGSGVGKRRAWSRKFRRVP